MNCFFTMADGFLCFHNLSRPDETSESYSARLMACLPGATRRTEVRDHHDLVIVRSGPLEARVDGHGADRGHVGRTVSIFFARAEAD